MYSAQLYHPGCAPRRWRQRVLFVYAKKRTSGLDVLLLYGAGNEARTRYLHLGKVALYQMSYARGTRSILPDIMLLVKGFLQIS